MTTMLVGVDNGDTDSVDRRRRWRRCWSEIPLAMKLVGVGVGDIGVGVVGSGVGDVGDGVVDVVGDVGDIWCRWIARRRMVVSDRGWAPASCR